MKHKDSTPAPVRDTAGFTLPEIALALVISLILLSLTFRAAQPALESTSVRSAEHVFRALSARARAHAIERGTMVRLNIDPVGDSVWITRGNVTVESYDFRAELGIDLNTNKGAASVCMTPRGFADPNCSSPSVFLTYFEAPGVTRVVKMLPMGQIVEP